MSMQAWSYYKNRIDELLKEHDYDTVPHPEVLKTDVFNEVMNLPSVGGVTGTGCPVTFVYVDINRDYIDSFKRSYPGERVYLMDIRDLQFSPGRFDMVLDCSTIDHIPFTDVEDVIYNYKKLLKLGGTLLLITWTAPEIRIFPDPVQYYHPRRDLESILSEYFTIHDIDDDIIPPDNMGGLLVAYTLTKVNV